MGRLKPTLILGGPGCGKTTALLNIVEQAFSRGVEPDRIAFVAFTRKAAQEARERMVEKFGIEADMIPYFRTLHSFAFSQLDIERSQILDDLKMRDYAKAEGLDLSEEFIDEFGQVVAQPHTEDEKALNAISLARLTQRPLEDVVIEHGLDFDFVKRIRDDYEEFKADAMLVDFTDMIERFETEGNVPVFDLLIVDEAQDLSRLQWRMVDRLMENAKDVYFAGDDDQAIYAWAGADLDRFLTMDADREVLPVSYRLKSEVFHACQKVIHLCDARYPKDWKPHADGGEIDFVSNLEDLDLSQGTWYLLARTNSLVRRYTKYLQESGYAYWSPTKHGMQSSVSVDPVQAVLIYENLRMGKSFSGDRLKLVWSHIRPQLRPASAPLFETAGEYTLADLCSTGFDASPSWLDALSISGGMQAYIRAMRARGESLTKPPRITAATIHAVKGGEADNVVVDQKLTSRTHSSWIACDPQEVRALFTAMSRAKQRLIFLETSSRVNYGVERILTC
ncbi:ATP-dependent DNA helicase [Pseudanabaena phage Pan1]|nr:ATP-dependent DNA helicase [Pseudanabaena phage Pan1]